MDVNDNGSWKLPALEVLSVLIHFGPGAVCEEAYLESVCVCEEAYLESVCVCV